MQKVLIGVVGIAVGLAIALALHLVADAQREALFVPQSIDFSKQKPGSSLQAFGGTLLGYDQGEWGGKLAFRDSRGVVVDVLPDNVHAIVPRGEDVLVFTGLAHMGLNEGAVYLLHPDAKRSFNVTQLHRLDGAPDSIDADMGDGAIDFVVFTDRDDRRGGWVYQCRRLRADLQIEALAECELPGPSS